MVSDDGTHWISRRNCSMTPAQLGGIFVALSAVSLSVAGFFWFMGVKFVLPFTAIELVALATAFLVHGRHATDQERISFASGRLVVEQESAGKTRRCEFSSHGLRIEPELDGDRLVELRGGGQVVRVGRFLRSDLRPVLAKEMRRALLAG
ncbi:MAG: DUF2244 domain-containing protein [Hydrogenophaga sp.]